MMNKSVKTAVFPVGGLGTRFLPATKSMPKEMLTVVDKPLIQYAFEEARNAGVEQFIFITGRNKNIISNHFDHAYELQKVLDEKEKDHLLSLAKDWLPQAGDIAFIRQQEPMGLGHAIYCARNFIGDNPFIVLLADEMQIPASGEKPLLQKMINLYNDVGGNIIGVADVDHNDVSKYGIIDPLEDDGSIIKIRNMVEKPDVDDAPSDISITGQYILQPKIFGFLENSRSGKDGEIQLTDALCSMIDEFPTYAVRFNGMRYDCGNRRGFLQANIAFALQHKEMHDDVIEMMKNFLSIQ